MKWKFSATLPLLAIGSTLVLATTNHAGADQLITFDDINTGTNGDVFPISNPYAGLNWNNFGVISPATSGQCLANCGYFFGMVSSPNVAFNILGNPASFSSSTPFTLNSFYLTADENDGLNVSVTGLLNGAVVDTATFTLSSTSPTLATFNWANINEVGFSASGGTPHGWVLPIPGFPNDPVRDTLCVRQCVDFHCPWPHCRCWLAWPDLRQRRPARLVAREVEGRPSTTRREARRRLFDRAALTRRRD